MASLFLRRFAVLPLQVAAVAMRSSATAISMRPASLPLITRSIATRTLKPINAKPKNTIKNAKCKLKSKQCAVKRFIVMGGGRIKRGHSGKVCTSTVRTFRNNYSDI